MAVPECSIRPRSRASWLVDRREQPGDHVAGRARIRPSNSAGSPAADCGVKTRQTSPCRSIRSTGESSRSAPAGKRAASASTRLLKPSRKRDEHAVACAAFAGGLVAVLPLPPHRPDQAAVLPLHVAEAGERGRDAELFHVGGIDRRHQRLDQPLEGLASQPAADEGGHALVAVVLPRRNEVFQGRPQLAQRAEDRRDGQRPQPRRGHHQEAVGQAIEPAAADDERPPARRVGLDELIGQPQPPAKFDAPGDRGNEVVGALLDLEAVVGGRSRARRPAAARPPAASGCSGASSTSRWAAARPAIPPPITAIRCFLIVWGSLTAAR